MNNVRRCQARRSDGGQCQRWALRGQLLCRIHGGGASQAIAAARRRQLDEDVKLVAQEASVKVEGFEPLLELRKTAAEAIAFKSFAAAQLVQLRELARDNPVTGAEQLRVVVSVYERALDRVAKTLADLVRLDVEGRITKISQAEGEVLAELVCTVLAEHGLDPGTDSVRVSLAGAMDRMVAAGRLAEVSGQ